MGVIARALTAQVPFPSGQPKRFTDWTDNFIGGSQPFRLPDEQDYRKKVGDGSGTSLITAVVNWYMRNLIPVRPVLFHSPSDDAVPNTIRTHPAIDLLRYPTRDPERAPNGYYSGTTLNMACAVSWVTDGNVYRLKMRSDMRRVVQRWYVPHYCIEPIGTGAYIDYYRYRVSGRTYELDPRDVDHLRFGLDPTNPRKGMSPIRGVLREIFTDEEAARFSAALLHNVGFPGAVVIPGEGVVISKKEDRDEMRDRFDQRFSADGRGRTIVLSANADVKFLQWSPKDLDLSSLRDVPEERVSSVSGVPAAVLGFGTGLQQVKVGATMRELRAQAIEDALIPFLEAIAENDTMSLLPEFIGASELPKYELGWDLSRVGAYSDLQKGRAEVEATLVRAGIKKRGEARRVFGLSTGPEDDIYLASPGVGGAPANSSPASENAPAEDAGEEEQDDAPAEEQDTAEALLTPREELVARMVQDGLASKQIAAQLKVSERTVERARAKIRKSELARQAAVDVRREQRDDTLTAQLAEISGQIAKNTDAVVEVSRAALGGMSAVAAAIAAPRPPQTLHVDATTKVEKGAIDLKVETPASPRAPTKTRRTVTARDAQGRPSEVIEEAVDG